MSRIVCTIAGVQVIEGDDGRVRWIAGAAIDADGCYRAYHPDRGKGIDWLGNAGEPGNWYGVVTDTGAPDGQPIVQGPNDPAPGYFVSATSYQHGLYGRTNPRRYVDAESVPYVVVSPLIRRGVLPVVLGCKARVTHIHDNRSVECVVADTGPRNKIGELSIAAARAIGIPSSPRTGGEEEKVIQYEIWPGVPAVVDGVEYELQAV